MTRRRFAEKTQVPIDRTRSELDALLASNGATQRGTFQDDEKGFAIVQFKMADRLIRLDVKCPLEGRNAAQEARAAWRRLLLVVKAKLEIIADGQSTVEREFLADVVLPDGRRVLDDIAPKLVQAYKSGKLPPLLGPAPSKE